MAWFRVDDSFYDHPKLEGVSMAARGLWVTAGTYCARHLTDGVITARQVRILGGTPAQIRALIDAGLWVRFESESGVDSYAFHDWIDMQPTRKQVLDRRADDAERKREARERKAANQRKRGNVRSDVRPDSDQMSGGLSALPDPTRPDPSLNTYVEREGDGGFTGAESAPSKNCGEHPGGTDKPCAGCGAARRAFAEWETAQRRQAAEAKSAAARQAAEDRQAEIDMCDLCDEHGYQGRAVCDHNPNQAMVAAAGVAKARAALRKNSA